MPRSDSDERPGNRGAPGRRRSLRRVLTFGSILLILAVAALSYARRHLDEWVRSAVERAAGERLGGDLRLGRVEVGLGQAEVAFSDLVFAAREGRAGSWTVEIPEGHVRLGWGGLVGLTTGHPRLEAVSLTRPHVVLHTDRRAPVPGHTGAAPFALWVGSLQVDGGVLQVDDRTAALNFRAVDVALTSEWSPEADGLSGTCRARLSIVEPQVLRTLALELQTAFVLTPDGLQVRGLEARDEGLALALDGRLNFSGEAVFKGRGTLHADLDLLGPRIAPRASGLAGHVESDYVVEVGPGPLLVRGSVRARGARFGPIEAVSLGATMRLEPGRLDLADLQAEAYEGQVRGSTGFAWGDALHVRADLVGTDLRSTALFGALDLPLPFASRVDAAVEIEGQGVAPLAWSWRGSFAARAAESRGAELPLDGRGEFTIADGKLDLTAGPVVTSGAEFEVRADLDLQPRPRRGRVELDGRTADAAATQAGTLTVIEALGGHVTPSLRTPLAGSGPVRATFDLGLDPLPLGLALELHAGSVGGQSFDRATLNLAGTLAAVDVQGFDVVRGAARISGSGRMALAPWSVEMLDLHARRIDPRALLDLAGWPLDLTGELDADIQVETDGLRTGSGRVRLSGGSAFGEPFDSVVSPLVVAGDTLRLTAIDLRAPALQARAVAEWSPGSGTLRIEVQQADLQVGELTANSKRTWPIGADVQLSGVVTDDARGLAGAIDFTTEGVRFLGQAVGRATGRATLEPAGLALQVQGAAGTEWSLSGRLGFGGEWPFEATVDLAEAVIQEVRPDASPEAGWASLGGRIELAGRARHVEDTEVHGRLDRATLERGGRRLELVDPATVDLAERRLSSGTVRLAGLGSRLEGRLDYDFERDEIHAAAEGQLDLAFLLGGVAGLRAAGPVDLHIEARGPASAPILSGTLQAADVRVRPAGLPQSLEHMAFRVTLDGARARLHDLRARLGNGEIAATGEATVDRFALADFQLAIDVTNVKLAYPRGFRGVYEGALEVRGTPAAMRVEGDLALLRGLYDRNFDLGSIFGLGGRESVVEPDESLPENVELDVSLRAPGNVWVRNDQAQIECGLDLHFGGSLRRLATTGRVFMVDGGRIVFQDVEYRVRAGSIDLVDQERFDPYLTLQAETTVRDYSILLRMEGTASRFDYNLTSEPALPTPDIIALLATGHTLQEIGAGSGSGSFAGDSAAAGYFAGALTGPFEKRLERLLGLERVTINPLLVEGDADPTTRVTLGEQVADDLMVLVSSDIGKQESQLYEVEWRASPRFRLTAKRDTQGGLGGNLRFTDRFSWRRSSGPRESPRPADPSAGPAPSAAPQVNAVRILGAPEADLAALRRTIHLKEGRPFSKSAMFDDVESLRRHYVRAGRIEARVDASEEAAGAGVDVVYRIDPGPSTTVRFSGVERKEERAVRAELQELWIDSLFSDDLYEDSANRIREHFQERGHFAADVTYRVEQGGAARAVLFEVDRGKPVRLREVRVVGAALISEERVRRSLLTRPSSLLARRLLVPSVLAEDVAGTLALYRHEGFLAARVRSQVHLSTAGDSATVDLLIEEGPIFRVAGVDYSPDTPFAEADLARLAALAPGDVFSPARLLEAESRLSTALDQRGYPNATVRGHAETGAAAVQVHFDIEPGTPKRVEEIRITGNHLTRTKVIRGQIDFKEGDVLSRGKLLSTQHRLYQLGLFRGVHIGYVPAGGDDPAAQRVEIRIEEAEPLSVTLGVGYDTEARAGVSFALSDDNVRGSRRALSLQGQFDGLERRLQIVGREPRLFNRDLPGLFTIGRSVREEVGFTESRRTSSMRVDRRLGPRWKTFGRYTFQRVDLSDVTISPDELQQDKLVEGRFGDLTLALIRDTRDDPFLPHRGTYFTGEVRLFAEPLLSDSSFAKGLFMLSRVHTLPRGVTLASAGRLGLAVPFAATPAIPISEAFFAGGDSTLRGFARDSVGPASGGAALLLLNEEMRFPLWKQLKGTLFYDAGNVYDRVEDLEPFDLRHVLGVGLRFETPIGPLRLEYGRKLDREVGESTGELFLAIGSAF